MASLRFGTAGVRGVFNKEFRVYDALSIAYGVAKALGPGLYGLGHDTRRFSHILAKAIMAELSWLGYDTIDFGMIPTPVLAFNIRRLNVKAGFSITASHNPPEYAGVKVFSKDGIELTSEVEKCVEGYMNRFSSIEKGAEFGVMSVDEEAIQRYIDTMISRVPKTSKRLKIVVDCGNGVGSIVTPQLLYRLGHHVIPLNSYVSWCPTARPFEPMEENLAVTAKIVKSLGGDIGLAHDGDADRVVLIDRDGRVLDDYIFSALMFNIVSQGRKGVSVLSVNTSNAVEELAVEYGCQVVRTRLGKTFHELFKVGGIFATEPSKIIDPRWGYWEDGIYSSTLLIQHLSSSDLSLQDLVNEVPRYFHRQININVENLDCKALAAVVKRHYENQEAKIEQLDGVKIIFKDRSWILFRASGTEPKVRIYAEAKSHNRVEQLLDEGVDLIQPAQSRV